MNAKHLIQGKVNEAEGEEAFGGTPPGNTAPQQRPMPRRPGGNPNSERPDALFSRMGRRAFPGGPEHEEGPPGFFSPKETNQLKDVLIFSLASLMGSEEDIRIAQALMAGNELDPGQLRHILDEASRLKLPESHKPILQKIFTKVSSGA